MIWSMLGRRDLGRAARVVDLDGDEGAALREDESVPETAFRTAEVVRTRNEGRVSSERKIKGWRTKTRRLACLPFPPPLLPIELKKVDSPAATGSSEPSKAFNPITPALISSSPAEGSI